jgi:spore germination cell wall hydrolase CwlJ-like protein
VTTIAIADDRPDLLALLREHWRAAVAVLLMAALFAITLMGIVQRDPARDAAYYAEVAASAEGREELRRAALATSATELRRVSAQDALAINEAIPVANVANPAARPFLMNGAGEAERLRALDCLTAAIYYEAANESTDGQRGVAQVVLNRVRHPAYPSTVCGVVFEGHRRYTGCQFSFTCDGSLRRTPMPAVWNRARTVAEAALNGFVYAPAGWATHYHANYVVPYWASSLVKTVTVGAHIFYRWRGGWGRPPAFLNRYRGAEPLFAWRGGFGQPSAQERALAAAAAGAPIGERDALAAAAAREAAAQGGSVDSFQRAVLRRYEPLRRDTATEIAREQVRASPPMSNSQRWALTGDDERASTPQQRPLGRFEAAPADENPPPAVNVPPAASGGGQDPAPLN